MKNSCLLCFKHNHEGYSASADLNKPWWLLWKIMLAKCSLPWRKMSAQNLLRTSLLTTPDRRMSRGASSQTHQQVMGHFPPTSCFPDNIKNISFLQTLKVTWMSWAITRAFIYSKKPTKQELWGEFRPCDTGMGLLPSVKFMSWHIKLKDKISTKQRQTGSIHPHVNVCHNRIKFFWLQMEVGQNNTTPSYFKLIAMQPS